ncbi:MAG: hypothetical protein M3Y56_07160 [Armatimonadota bacterium]|nr:hypothetical protein [Armatimonadota bacterium]
MSALILAKFNRSSDALLGSQSFPSARTIDFAAACAWSNSNNPNYTPRCGGGGMAA